MDLRYLLFFVFALISVPSQAALIQFDLLGKAGPGLLRLNEAPVVPLTGGSGGEIGSGIVFNDVTRDLAISIGWGSGHGFADLTGDAIDGHVHAPTPNLPPASFNEATAPLVVLTGLPGWNPSNTNGSFVGNVTIPQADVAALLQGRLYINIHTPAHPDGEIRANLMPVPEPELNLMLAFGGLALAGALLRRRGVHRL